MADETAAALREIANLLRRRVEQHDEWFRNAQEVQRQAAENMAQINQGRTPNLERIREETQRRMEEAPRRSEEAVRKGEQRAQELRQAQERRDEESRQFRQRLLAQLERLNGLLERLVAARGE